MATTTEEQTNGTAGTADSIVVENPATGEVVTTLPATTPEQLNEMGDKGRRALALQPIGNHGVEPVAFRPSQVHAQ